MVYMAMFTQNASECPFSAATNYVAVITGVLQADSAAERLWPCWGQNPNHHIYPLSKFSNYFPNSQRISMFWACFGGKLGKLRLKFASSTSVHGYKKDGLYVRFISWSQNGMIASDLRMSSNRFYGAGAEWCHCVSGWASRSGTRKMSQQLADWCCTARW